MLVASTTLSYLLLPDLTKNIKKEWAETIYIYIMVNTSVIWQQAAHTIYYHFLAAQQEPLKKNLYKNPNSLSLTEKNIEDFLTQTP